MIYLIWGPPGAGKTYFATREALRQHGKGRSVYSNYPVVDARSGWSSYVWKPEYIYETVTDAVIIIDEAYRDYSSREYRKFNADMHTFFATQRHNDLDVFLIAQNPARIDVVIREIVNVFYYVRKWFELPLVRIPLGFTVTGYLTEEDMNSRATDAKAIYSRERIIYSPRVAAAYDTHYFRAGEQTLSPITWSEYQKTLIVAESNTACSQEVLTDG